MQCTRTNISQKGFTLIEMMVIAPIVVLFIGLFVVYISTLIGETTKLNARNTAAYEVQNALSLIEDDASKSTYFLATLYTDNGSFPFSPGSPQDSDASSGDFITAASLMTPGNALIIKGPATTTNPHSRSRALVYLATPDSTCAASTITSNDVYDVVYVYFINSNNLYRRTIMGNTSTAYCSGYTPWQRPSCPASQVATYPLVCKAADELLVHNVSAMNVSYYISGTTTTAKTTYNWSVNDTSSPIGLNNTGPPVAINASITAQQSSNVPAFTASIRVASTNIRD